VIVDAILPVDVGLAVSLYCAMSASSAAWLDEPVREYATVLRAPRKIAASPDLCESDA
jgi:hypothetical protein